MIREYKQLIVKKTSKKIMEKSDEINKGKLFSKNKYH